jgi:hypothetical protein
MILGHDYVYAMNVVMFILFCVMHFPHSGSIVTIYQISYDNYHPSSYLSQVSTLYVLSVQVDSSPPRVSYVASYPQCSISYEKESLKSCFSSRDKVSKID